MVWKLAQQWGVQWILYDDADNTVLSYISLFLTENGETNTWRVTLSSFNPLNVPLSVVYSWVERWLRSEAYPYLRIAITLSENEYSKNPSYWSSQGFSERSKTQTVPFGGISNAPFTYHKIIVLPFNPERYSPTQRDPIPKVVLARGAPWPRYSASGRCVSYMHGVCTSPVRVPEAQKLYLPVVRYPSLYYRPREETEISYGQCDGKFYYVEPESKVLLDLGRVGIYASKVQAYRLLRGKEQVSSDEIEDLQRALFRTPYWSVKERQPELAGLTPPISDFSFSFTPRPPAPVLRDLWEVLDEEEVWPYYGTLYSSAEETTQELRYSPLLRPEGKESHSVQEASRYDFLDPLLCGLARQHGIDTLVFQHEQGQDRSVTELLDVRVDSYDYLLRTEASKPWWQWSEQWPTIYFLEYGLITNKAPCRFVVDPERLNVVEPGDCLSE